MVDNIKNKTTAGRKVEDWAIVQAWTGALGMIDLSEVYLRDFIERSLSPVAQARRIRRKEVEFVMRRLSTQIANLRVTAIKQAFLLIIDRLQDDDTAVILGQPLNKWAVAMARDDLKRIDSEIRIGLVRGFGATEIARKVVGSIDMNGVDGVTETTRRRIAQLGRAVIKAKRMQPME